jgi:hypothetical protein
MNSLIDFSSCQRAFVAPAPSPQLCRRRPLTWAMFMTFPPATLAASTHVGAVQHFPRACVYHRPLCPLSHEADSTLHPPLSGVGTASGTGSPAASGSGPTGHASSALSVCPHYERRPATR